MSDDEREELTRRQERAGWLPRETCECDEPEVGALVGGDRFYMVDVCLRCRRRLRFDEREET
jgi:hypothetical protein